MYNLLVSDASILIDLLDIELLSPFFSWVSHVSIPDIVFAEISKTTQESRLSKYKHQLAITQFNSDELETMQGLAFKHSGLSIADCSLIYHARNMQVVMLTSDKALTRIAKHYGIEVHGIVWLFKNLVDHEYLTPTQAVKKIRQLIEINPRAPRVQLTDLINTWRKNG